MATRFLIGQAELLTYDIPPPPIIPSKAHPYRLALAATITAHSLSSATQYD